MEVNVHILDVCLVCYVCFSALDETRIKRSTRPPSCPPHNPTTVSSPACFSASDSLLEPSRYSYQRTFSHHRTFFITLAQCRPSPARASLLVPSPLSRVQSPSYAMAERVETRTRVHPSRISRMEQAALAQCSSERAP